MWACRSPVPDLGSCWSDWLATPQPPTYRATPSASWTSEQLDLGFTPGLVRSGHVHRRPRLRVLDAGVGLSGPCSTSSSGREPTSACGCSASTALNSLRLDKSFGSWAREYRPIYDPFEAGLGSVCEVRTRSINQRRLERRDRLSAATLLSRESGETGPERRLLTWTVDVDDRSRDPATAADVIGDEPVWFNGEVVGWVTSGGYAHFSDASVALGYVPCGAGGLEAGKTDGSGFEIEILGVRRKATPRRAAACGIGRARRMRA